nr:molybdopterin-guanine dinucleotide biosynthesis protein B [Lachnospiraceae bacterium]
MGRIILGIAGFSGSGKTTLIEKLIPVLKNEGYRIAVIKHDAHDFEMDREGKDTFRFKKAGVDTVMISSRVKSAMISDIVQSLDKMIADAYERGADIVLVEGYKYENIPKLFVLSKRCGYEVPEEIKGCVAIASDDTDKVR